MAVRRYSDEEMQTIVEKMYLLLCEHRALPRGKLLRKAGIPSSVWDSALDQLTRVHYDVAEDDDGTLFLVDEFAWVVRQRLVDLLHQIQRYEKRIACLEKRIHKLNKWYEHALKRLTTVRCDVAQNDDASTQQCFDSSKDIE